MSGHGSRVGLREGERRHHLYGNAPQSHSSPHIKTTHRVDPAESTTIETERIRWRPNRERHASAIDCESGIPLGDSLSREHRHACVPVFSPLSCQASVASSVHLTQIDTTLIFPASTVRCQPCRLYAPTRPLARLILEALPPFSWDTGSSDRGLTLGTASRSPLHRTHGTSSGPLVRATASPHGSDAPLASEATCCSGEARA